MNETVRKNGIQFGIIMGLVSIIITTLIYTINVEYFISSWIGIVKNLFYLALVIILLSKTKKALLNNFSFKDAFTTYFICVAIGITLGSIFEIILFNVIDPSLKETLKEMTIKFTKELLSKFGTPSSTIKESIKALKESDPYSIGKFIQGNVITILISAIFGLILAAIFKSNSSNQLK